MRCLKSKQSMVSQLELDRVYVLHEGVQLINLKCYVSTDELISSIKQEKLAEIQQQQEKNKAIERRRKYLLETARKKEETLKYNAKSKIERDEARKAEQQRELKREHDLRKAEKDILMAMKQDNLARIKRMQEYQQKETLRKVALNERKSAEMKKKKAELLGE